MPVALSFHPVRQTSEREYITLFGCLTALTALSIDAVLSALPVMASELSSAATAAVVTQVSSPMVASAEPSMHLIISALVLGMAVGEPVFGPLADARGRKFAILTGMSIFLCGSLLATLAADMQTLLLARFIQGVGVAGPKIGSRAAIRDRYRGEAMARAMSIIMTVLILVPMLAPALGEWIMQLGSWRLVFAAYCLLALPLGAWLLFRQPEPLTQEKRTPFHWRRSWLTACRITGNARVLPYTLAAGLMFGCLTSYYGMAASIFTDIYGIPELFTTLFAVLALGMGIASLINSRLVMRLGSDTLSRLALAGMSLGALLLLLLSLDMNGAPPLYVFMGLCMICLFCIGILFGNLGAMAMEPLGAVAGIGASVIASLSSLLAVVVSVICGNLYDQTVIPLAACLCLSALTSLFLLRIARRSKRITVQPAA